MFVMMEWLGIPWAILSRLQLIYGEDKMDSSAFVWQCFHGEVKYGTFGLNDHEFEHIYRIDVTDPSGGFLPGILQVGIDNSSLELQSKLDAECAQLVEN